MGLLGVRAKLGKDHRTITFWFKDPKLAAQVRDTGEAPAP
jgi:hypothetical protein